MRREGRGGGKVVYLTYWYTHSSTSLRAWVSVGVRLYELLGNGAIDSGPHGKVREGVW